MIALALSKMIALASPFSVAIKPQSVDKILTLMVSARREPDDVAAVDAAGVEEPLPQPSTHEEEP